MCTRSRVVGAAERDGAGVVGINSLLGFARCLSQLSNISMQLPTK